MAELVQVLVEGKWFTGIICYVKGDKIVVSLWDDTILEVQNENVKAI